MNAILNGQQLPGQCEESLSIEGQDLWTHEVRIQDHPMMTGQHNILLADQIMTA